MRIAIVTRNARVVGGVETYLDTVIPLLEAAGHEISILCEHDDQSTAQPITRDASAPVWRIAEMGAQRSLEALRRWQPDLIYSHGVNDLEIEARALALAPAMIFAHDYRAVCISGSKAFASPKTRPCVRPLGMGCLANFYPRRCGGLNPITMFEDYRGAVRRLALLRSVRAVLTGSEYVRAEYLRNGLAPASVRCVGLPIVDRGPRQVTVAIGQDALASRPSRLLFAGRMEPLKGGQILLDALPIIASALSRPLVLTFAGAGGARVEWTRQADDISRREPSIRIEFVGWKDTNALNLLFDASDLLVVPSLWPEPFGMVGPEAGMRGLPAAAFAVGGVPEWLTDGVNGALAR
ncbi:MAG: glycosyltransferase family 4 protein, partial [Deltaproteobacteria bacterium]|nr:glycosyltransferase family 4 protein [Deltaproteobacteria bacterium]